MAFLAITILNLYSCTKDVSIVNEPDKFNPNIKLSEYSKSLDFLKDTIIDLNGYFLIEGDILIDKNKHPNIKQAYITNNEGYLITYTKQNNITVRIDSSIPSSGEDNWRDAIANAINDWNSIGDCQIHFTLTTDSNADITIQSDKGDFYYTTYVAGLGYVEYVLAAAEFPDGYPGYRIRINLDFYGNYILSQNQMRYNIVHELGHCIGLRHTNWSGLGESTANQIVTTPTSESYSIMNGGTAFNSWVGFTAYDVRAIQVLYPNTYYEQLGGVDWYNTNAVTSLDGWIYLVQNSRLYKVNANDGSYEQLGGANWYNANAMTSLNGWLYIVKNSRFYKVDPSDGTYTQLGGAVWSNTNAMTSLNGWIYLVQNSRFYRVEPNNGSYVQLGSPEWYNTETMTSLNGWIYLVQNARIYQVDPSNGSYYQIGEVGWSGTDAMASLNGYLYLVQNSLLHKVDATDGSYVILGMNIWGGTYGMTSMNDKLYLAQNSRFYSITFN